MTLPNRLCWSCSQPLTDAQVTAHDEDHGADCQCRAVCGDPECQKEVA